MMQSFFASSSVDSDLDSVQILYGRAGKALDALSARRHRMISVGEGRHDHEDMWVYPLFLKS